MAVVWLPYSSFLSCLSIVALSLNKLSMQNFFKHSCLYTCLPGNLSPVVCRKYPTIICLEPCCRRLSVQFGFLCYSTSVFRLDVVHNELWSFSWHWRGYSYGHVTALTLSSRAIRRVYFCPNWHVCIQPVLVYLIVAIHYLPTDWPTISTSATVNW